MNSLLRAVLWLLLIATACLNVIAAEVVRYSYDDAGRLIGAYHPGGNTIQYVYDGAGNLVRQIRTTFTDADSDGMDDSWETAHFGDTSRNGTGDFDNDGVTDLAEFMAGTIPTDDTSLLAVTQTSASSGVSFTIQWASVPGKSYRVQYNDGLDPAGWKNLGGDITATGATTSRTDTSVSGSSKRFYRIVALF